MIKNKIFIVCLLLCLCFSIQTIYAADIDSGIIQESQTVEFDGTTFSELQNEINHLNDDDAIILNNDITQDNTNAVEINKNIIITGKDITINAQNKSNIFNINSKKVIISNITFINGNNDKGGAINSYADLTITNCKFINNYAGGIYGEGGGIFTLGNLTVTDSLFENNYASAGGAINSYAAETLIETTKLINNCARWYGGAIYHDHILRIKSSLFANNTAYSGGAMHHTVTTPSWELWGDVIITDSNFTKNSANFGGALSTSGIQEMTYDNCNFIDNYADRGAVVYKNAISIIDFNNCLIDANNAKEGAVIYDDSKVNLFDSRSIFFISNTILKNNQDLGKASIFYARDCNIIITNATIANNSNNPIYNGNGNISVINSGIFNNSGIFITQFYMGNITVVNNTWDKKDPKVDEIINCTSDSTVIYSNSDLSVDLDDMLNINPPKIKPGEMDCASTVVRVNETEFVLSQRRDGGIGYSMTDYVDYRDDYVIEFKSMMAYFFLSKVYANGWLIGTGGWDSSAENEKVEALASDMVLNENINMQSLELIMAAKNVAGAGHLLIISPNGTYGNVIVYPDEDSIIKIGVLNDGDYILSPNGPTYRQEGHLDNITDPVYSNMYLSANDAYGYDRHCVVVHHVTLEEGNFIDDIYCANDDGSYVDLDNGELSDNYWFGEEYTRDVEVPIILDKKHLGTYSNMLFESELIGENMTIYVSDALEGFDYQVVLNDKDNKPIGGKEVQFSFNGNEYNTTTDSEGIASVRLSASKAASYTINAIFTGDERYSPARKNATIKVIKQSVEIVGPKYAVYNTNEFKYHAAFKTSTGKVLSNEKVTVTFNGKKQQTYTDGNGYLTVTLKADKPGYYGIKLEFEGNDLYEGVNEYKYIEIAKQSSDVPISYENDITKNDVKIPNETMKSQQNNNTKSISKETTVKSTQQSNDYSLATYIILAVVALGTIAIIIKRRNQ